MNKLFYILFISFCFLSCNNKKTKSSVVEKSMLVSKQSELNETTQSKNLFDLIQNKKETAQGLPKDFDFSKNYTDKELKSLNLDPIKIDVNEYYFLSQQNFLKEEIEGLTFQIYYKHLYGYQLEKILRVQRTDTVFDIILSGKYSNDLDYSTLSTEFRSDNLFKKSCAEIQTIKEESNIEAYYIDSVWTFYRFNNHLDLTKNKEFSSRYYKEIIQNPETGIQDTLFEKIVSLGKIQNTEFLYGVSYVPDFGNLPETITIYSKNKNEKIGLEIIETVGAYIDDVEVFTFAKNHFIYVKMMETSGNSYSYFYAVDMKKMLLNEVEQDYGNFKFPDSLQIYKGFGITKENDNKFISGGLLSSENGRSYYFDREHKMTKENGKFVLKCIDTKIQSTE